MVAARRRFAALLAVALAAPCWAQTRVAPPAASLGGSAVPLTPFSFPAPVPSFSASLPSLAAPAISLSPPAASPAPAARGEAVALNGAVLPARMFSDQDGIAGHLIRAIDAAAVSIDIALHGLELWDVAAALARAKARGVRVRVVMNQTHVFPDRRRARSPEVQLLIDEGFEMKMLRGGDEFGVMHNKIALFDDQILETGSFNWSHAADTRHWENAMFHADRARLAAYQSYWDWMWSIASEIPKDSFERPAAGWPVPPRAPQDPARPVRFNGEEFPGQAFSPGGVTVQLVRAIDASRVSIDLANFSFTSEDLRDALLRAKARGVVIRVVFDADQYQFLPEMHWFAEHGFDLLLSHGKDGVKGVMHNKFAVFDGSLLEAGSFNWTRNGEKNNFENAMFLDSPDDVAAYAAYFARVRAQAFVP